MENTGKQRPRSGKLPIHSVIGSVFGQTITGTLFKHKVIDVIGERNKLRWLKVENIETGHRQIICESELHCL